jgi:hypothetical protein
MAEETLPTTIKNMSTHVFRTSMSLLLPREALFSDFLADLTKSLILGSDESFLRAGSPARSVDNQ